jgi:putative ABC transport system substrate-binding protein
MRAAERAIGVTLLSIELRSAADIDGALARLADTQADALVVYHNSLIRAYRDRILQFAENIKLPAMYEAAEYVEAGGLMAYGVTHVDLFRQSANYVDKILKGAKPADIPVEQPTKITLVLNRRAAAILGIAIPPTLLLRADRVVE